MFIIEIDFFIFDESLSVTDRLSFMLIQRDGFFWLECQMLIMEHIAQLVSDAICPPDNLIKVPVRMSVYPIIYWTADNIIGKFHRKSTVQRAAFELWCEQFKRRYMVRHNNDVFFLASGYAIFQKVQTFVVLHVESCPVERNVTATSYAPEIGYCGLCVISVLLSDFRPQCSCDNLCTPGYGNDGVVIAPDI